MSATTELRLLALLELTFPLGLPGFKRARHFRLEPLGGETRPHPFGRLVALEPVELADGTLAETVRLIVAAPGLLWPHYRVEIDDDVESLLGIDDPADAAALVVVTLNDSIEPSTANLAAPIVINTARHLATQIVPGRIDGPGGWSMRAPLPLPALDR
jgi:flagellar assembly factor FliW